MNRRDFVRIIINAVFVFTLIMIITAIIYLYQLIWVPRFESLGRKVFEETQSYVHGANQELAKLYEEWSLAESDEERAAVEEVVRMRFAQFPPEKVENRKLREWFERIITGR